MLNLQMNGKRASLVGGRAWDSVCDSLKGAWFAPYLLAVPLLALNAAPLRADSIVVPNNDASATGNDSSGSFAYSAASLEFQDDYLSSQFSAAGGPIWITGLAFRMKPNTGSLSVTDTSLKIYLSTTQYAPNTSSGGTLLTSNLAANKGPDNTLVGSEGSGTLWSGTSCTGAGPCPFNLGYTFSTPFLYNPSSGNLLSDLLITGFVGSGSGQQDVANYFANPSTAAVDEVGSVNGGPVFQEYSDSVVQFYFTPLSATPEPSSFVLLGSGLLLGLVWEMRRRFA